MKVKELLENLQGLSPELDVILTCEDENITKGNNSTFFICTSIEVNKAEPKRLDDDKRSPTFTYGNGSNSREFVFLEITTIF